MDVVFNTLTQMFIIFAKIELHFQESKPNIRIEVHYLLVVFSSFAMNSRDDLDKHIGDMIDMSLTHLSKSLNLRITKLFSSDMVLFKLIVIKFEE
jgi:hypothetical protein